jgi:hypothetical protein
MNAGARKNGDALLDGEADGDAGEDEERAPVGADALLTRRMVMSASKRNGAALM